MLFLFSSGRFQIFFLTSVHFFFFVSFLHFWKSLGVKETVSSHSLTRSNSNNCSHFFGCKILMSGDTADRLSPSASQPGTSGQIFRAWLKSYGKNSILPPIFLADLDSSPWKEQCNYVRVWLPVSSFERLCILSLNRICPYYSRLRRRCCCCFLYLPAEMTQKFLNRNFEEPSLSLSPSIRLASWLNLAPAQTIPK